MVNRMGLRQTIVGRAPEPVGTQSKGGKINLQRGPRNGGGEDGHVVSDVADFIDNKSSVKCS